jgi:hypothetical protein
LLPASVNGSNPSAGQMQLSQLLRDPTSFWILPLTPDSWQRLAMKAINYRQ